MPTAPKRFRICGDTAPQVRPFKKLSAAKAGYDRTWSKFRAYIASIRPPVCVHCNKSYPSRQMHLDHEPALTGPDDPGRLEESRVQWLCISCHGKKTCKEDGGGWRGMGSDL